MTADLHYLHPIAADVTSGPWRDKECVIVEWAGNTGCWVQFTGERGCYQLRRDELRLIARPARRRLASPARLIDDGNDWPGAA